jgi:hypothetical protein
MKLGAVHTIQSLNTIIWVKNKSLRRKQIVCPDKSKRKGYVGGLLWCSVSRTLWISLRRAYYKQINVRWNPSSPQRCSEKETSGKLGTKELVSSALQRTCTLVVCGLKSHCQAQCDGFRASVIFLRLVAIRHSPVSATEECSKRTRIR